MSHLSGLTLDGAERQKPRKSGSDTPISILDPDNRQLFHSASPHVFAKKARRVACIERREIAGLLSCTKANSDAGAPCRDLVRQCRRSCDPYALAFFSLVNRACTNVFIRSGDKASQPGRRKA
jgi:hypothetical protein